MFWLLATLLTLCAIAFVVVPLLRTGQRPAGASGGRPAGADRRALNATLYEEAFAELERQRDAGTLGDDDFEELRRELSLQLVADTDQPEERAASAGRPLAAVLLVALLPLAAWQLYQVLGSWDAWRLTQRVEQVNRSLTGGEQDAGQLAALLGDMNQFTQGGGRSSGESQPDWLFLQARTAMRVGAYPLAATQFARLVALEPGNADLMGWRVQAVYLAKGRRMDAEVKALIDQTLAINPHQSTVLSIRGMNAFESGDYALAVSAWSQALAGMPPGSPSATMLEQGISQARQAMGEAGPAVAAQTGPTESVPQAGMTGFDQGIRVHVELDVAAEVTPGSTVFVIASAPEGGMPYAVVRLPVEGLPTEVTLDDSNSMTPNRSLSRQREVKVTARVSSSGNAMAQAGDWQGRSPVMTPGTVPPVVAIHIDQQI